jgi:hypothetical protein
MAAPYGDENGNTAKTANSMIRQSGLGFAVLFDVPKMLPRSDRQHDAFDNPAKALCRAGNLRVLREAANRVRGRPWLLLLRQLVLQFRAAHGLLGAPLAEQGPELIRVAEFELLQIEALQGTAGTFRLIVEHGVRRAAMASW